MKRWTLIALMTVLLAGCRDPGPSAPRADGIGRPAAPAPGDRRAEGVGPGAAPAGPGTGSQGGTGDGPKAAGTVPP